MGLERAAAQPTPHDHTDPGRPATPMDQHDRYLLPDPSGQREGPVPWTRASTVKKRIQNSEALTAYNEVMLAKGLAIAPDLTALVVSTPLNVRGSRDVILEAVEQAKVRAGARAAANYGSALHAFTEQIDGGEPLAEVLERVPDVLQADVQAYVDTLATYGLTPVPAFIERIVINTRLRTGDTWDHRPGTRKDAAAGVAARFDRMYLWTDPADGVEYLVPGDLKTGKNAVLYGSLETCVQEAIAAQADLMWSEDDEAYVDLPPRVASNGTRPSDLCIRTDIGILVHLPVGTGTCHLEQLDLHLGWKVAQMAVELMLVDKAKNHCHRPFGATVDDPKTPVAAPVAAGPNVTPEERFTSSAPWAPTEEQGPVPVSAGKAADGSELMPLAHETGAKRSCGVCGRVGHRSGSVKCWGDDDPAARAHPPVPTPQEQVLNGVERAREHPEQRLPRPCPHAAGFTSNPDGVWKCTQCGQAAPTQPAEDTEEVAAQSSGDDLEPDPAEEWAVFRCITEAKDRADLQQIRRDALAAKTWTPEHTKAGIARLLELEEVAD